MAAKKTQAPLADVAPATYAFLRKLKSTADAGFEGLVGRVLEAETGQRFRRVWSGSQHGRDRESEANGGCLIYMEAKHYFAANLDQRELVAEIEQAARHHPPPDLWVLATPASVNPDGWHELVGVAAGYGFDCLRLDGEDRGIPRPLVLLAAHPGHVVDFAQRHAPGADIEALRRELAAVAANPFFPGAYEQLRRTLGGTLLGHADAVRRARERLRDVLSRPGDAESRFNQDVAVLAPGRSVVRRSAVHDALSAWFRDDAAAGVHAAVLGEEGTGKTWAAFDWLAALSASEAPTIVLPFSASAQAIADGQTIGALLPRLLRDWTGIGTEEHWCRRLDRWLDHREHTPRWPLVLVLADGLNERSGVRWPLFFGALQEERWTGRVAVVATDRPAHRDEACHGLEARGFRVRLPLCGYDDNELAAAMGASDARYRDVPTELQTLMRTPRYHSLVCKHFAELRDSGDFTKARVLYLDARARTQTKLGYPITAQEFDEIVRDAALRHREAKGRMTRHEIAELLPFPDKERDVVTELTTGGVLRPSGRSGYYEVEPTRLAYALGLLLADVLAEQAARDGTPDALADAIGRWFEPEANADLKVEAAGAALFHATLDPSYSQFARRELLRYWLGLRNWDRSAETAFAGYILRIPEDFVAVADGFWGKTGEHGAAQDFLVKAFTRYRDAEGVSQYLVAAVERWSGIVHADGSPFNRPHEGFPRNGPTRAEIADRLGEPVGHREHDVFGHRLGATEDDGLLQLRRVGLLIASAGSRLPFARAFVTWAVSSAVMGASFEDDVAAWVLWAAEEDLDAALLPDCRRLFATSLPLAEDAARRLLRCLGTRSARALLAERPGPPDEAMEKCRREHEADPCNGPFALTPQECRACLARPDAPPVRMVERAMRWITDPDWPVPEAFVRRCGAALTALDPRAVRAGLDRSYQDHTIERLELVLASRDADGLADFWRRVLATLPDRMPAERRRLAFDAPGLALALTAADAPVLLVAAQRLGTAADAEPKGREGRFNQHHLAATQLVLAIIGHLPPDERWDVLSGRPDTAFDNVALGEWFEAPSAAVLRRVLATLDDAAATPVGLLRALWFAAGARPELDDAQRARIVRLAQHEHTGLRGTALRFASRSGDARLAREAIALGQAYVHGAEMWPIQWGAELLVRHAGHLPIEQVASRLHPASLTHLVRLQARTDEDVGFVADAFDAAWARVVGGSAEAPTALPDVEAGPDDDAGMGWPALSRGQGGTIGFTSGRSSWLTHPPPPGGVVRAAMERPNAEEFERRAKQRHDALILAWGTDALSWYGRGFDAVGLQRLLQVRPHLGRRWAEGAMRDGPAGDAARARLSTFHPALAVALLDADPDLGGRFWRWLADVEDAGLPRHPAADAAFAAGDNAATERARDVVLERCRSDDDLCHAATLAHTYGRGAWLRRAIGEHVRSAWLWRRAKGLALAGFSHLRPEGFEGFVAEAAVEGTWVADHLEHIRLGHETDRHARIWFERFASAEDDVGAWGAFRMFLACADERAYAWSHMHGGEGEGRPWRRRAYFAINRSGLRDAIRDRQHDRRDKLFGRRTPAGEVSPFLGAYGM